MKSQNPYVSEAVERSGRDDAGRPVAEDPLAAEHAMESDHQAFTGAATGVGSVAFDDPGAFSVGGGAETAAEPAGED